MEQIKAYIFLGVFIITWLYMLKEKQRIPEGQVRQDSLIRKEKILIWVLCLLNPILAGATLYFGLKRKLPVKAKQANQISWSAFFIELVLSVIVIVLG